MKGNVYKVKMDFVYGKIQNAFYGAIVNKLNRKLNVKSCLKVVIGQKLLKYVYKKNVQKLIMNMIV